MVYELVTGSLDPIGNWTNEPYGYDGDAGTDAKTVNKKSSETWYLTYTEQCISRIKCSFWCYDGYGTLYTFQIWVYDTNTASYVKVGEWTGLDGYYGTKYTKESDVFARVSNKFKIVFISNKSYNVFYSTDNWINPDTGCSSHVARRRQMGVGS